MSAAFALPRPADEFFYLQTLLPLLVCGITAVIIVAALIRKILISNPHHTHLTSHAWKHLTGYRKISQHPDEPSNLPDSASDLTDVEDELDRNAHVALFPTSSHVDKTTTHEADRPFLELPRVALELLCSGGEVALGVAFLVNSEQGSAQERASVAQIVVWSYTSTIVLVRLCLTMYGRVSLSALWYSTACIYGFTWMAATLLLRSYVIHAPSQLYQNLMIGTFALNTALLVIALASRPGNRPVKLEYEGNIPPAREVTASLFSLATFSWVDAIVWQGYKRTTEVSDVWNLAPVDKAANILYEYRKVKQANALAWHLLSYFKIGLFVQALWAALSGVLTFAPTVLLKNILEYVETPDQVPRNSAWFFVGLLFVSGCASALADGIGLWLGRKMCIRSRAIIIGELYAKALKRKVGASAEKTLGKSAKSSDQAKDGKKEQSWLKSIFSKKLKKEKTASTKAEETNEDDGSVSSGAIINLMAVDSFKVSELTAYLHFLWASAPVQVVVAIALLYSVLGKSSITGIGAMIVLLPINIYISAKFASMQEKILAATDARINTTNEVLSNIRIIKFFAWEQRFLDSVDEVRKKELSLLRSRYILWASAATIWGGAPIIITFLSFAFYTMVEQKPLKPSVAFTALSLFQILRIPLDRVADMVAHVQDSRVSVDRIEEYLKEEDTQKYKQLKHPEVEDAVIGFDRATFAWGSKAMMERDTTSSFRMIDLNMRFAVGKLNVIAGPTGSGKTSMLMALLGEMTKLEGNVYLPGARSREEMIGNPQTGLTESVAYCAQQAWLVNDTVKQNIIFASPWDGRRYKQVIEACSLKKDFEILDNGDETLVGEKGVTLSGGQKQRISLARAIYSNARHLLLDDILSAVDSHTAKWIFQKAIMGPLMFDRTCILVTHNVSLALPESQFVVLLDNGRITASGSVDEIIRSGKLADELIKSTVVSRTPSRPDTPVAGSPKDASGAGTEANGIPVDALPTTANKKDDPLAGPSCATDTPSANAMRESKAEGSVKLSLILMYLKAMGGPWFWTTTACAFVLQQISSISTNVWIRYWASAYAEQELSVLQTRTASAMYLSTSCPQYLDMSSVSAAWHLPFLAPNAVSITSNVSYAVSQQAVVSPSTTTRGSVDAGYYLGFYALLGAIYMFITFFREFIVFAGSISASKKIHASLMESVSRAKFRFFDSTPLGQIMNRFSKDIESLDQETAPVAVGLAHDCFSIISVVILITVITPQFLLAGIVISVIYYLIGKFYIGASRDLKRIESTQRSPLYQQFGETLAGMVTIRAYGDERRFIRENLNRINMHNRPFIYTWATNRWLAFRVDIAGALVSFFAGVFVLLSVGRIDAGAAGLAMTYAVTFTESVLWLVRLYGTNEQNMNSVERIKEYLDVEQEAPAYNVETQPAADWPSKGEVEFRSYTTRYRKEFEPVLRDLSFKIAPCEKIGVVGRTGAGKSSLAMALFRALEAEEGSIWIDGIDISTIGLNDLRENIVMVPQDPTLFSGTLRSNLDPFGLFTDEDIFAALRKVQLIGSTAPPASPPQTPLPAVVLPDAEAAEALRAQSDSSDDTSDTAVNTPSAENKNIFWTLSSPVSESGSNLSQGQRQLLCLARAMLKSPKVLLMDEATASIDYSTDSKIQETIRELKDNTIITIAHRLKTIVDYDRVIVMEQGRIVEYGEPWILIKPEDAHAGSPSGSVDDATVRDGSKRWFREMCEQSGELSALEEEAYKSWKSKRLIDDS